MDEYPFVLPFIRWADYSPFWDGQIMPRRRLYDHELVYVAAGRGHIMVADVVHDAVPDRLFLISPRVWHSFRADAGADMMLLGVHFDWVPQHDSLVFPIYEAATEPVNEGKFRKVREVPGWSLGRTPYLDLQARPRVKQLLDAVVAEFAVESAEAALAAGAQLAAALIQIGREARSQHRLRQLAPYGADAARRVERARALLEEPRTAPLSIEQAAAEVGWSADHLRRMFRAVLDTSPARIQTAARIRRARYLLRNEAQPIREVAYACGFDDPSHFARVFKKETGLSPRQFVVMARKS